MWKGTNSVACAILTACCLGCEDSRPTAVPEGTSASRPASAPAAKADGLHNVLRVTERLISGSVPAGDADFAQLRAMGVKTIVTVDGAAPDVERARAHGLRYVHLPIGYHGIDEQRQFEIARAIRDLPGPVYLHCHHGKHRGPAAAASAAVVLGAMSPDEGVAFLKRAGTAESYQGLYKCVLTAAPASPAMLDGVPADFPEVAPVPSFVKAMAEAQETYDQLVEVRDAGWQIPTDHPDLVPLNEAGRLEGLMRTLQNDPQKSKHADDFAALLLASLERTQEFESALKAQSPHSELTSKLNRVGASCKECHARYRDNH